MRLGEAADLLDELEEPLALLLDDRLPEQVAELMDLPAEGISFRRHRESLHPRPWPACAAAAR
jgi:hypothetical protein